MFVRPEDDPRSEGGFHDERSMLVGYLRDYRLTLELKCSASTRDLPAARSYPSTLSLLGWCGTWPRSNGAGSGG